MNILITSAGRRVSLVRSFQKEVSLLGLKSHVFTVDMKPELSAGCIASDKYFVVPPLSDKTYIASLLDICVKNDIKIVIPTIDTELLLLAESYKLFLDNNVQIIISDIELIKLCRDKRLTHLFFRENGISFPQEYTKDDLKFPLFIKPYDGSCSSGIYFIEDKSKLMDYHINNPNNMFLEYIDKKEYNEYTVDLYYDRNSILKCVVPRLRIEVRSGEILKGVTCKNKLVTFFKEKLHQINGLRGCITLQVFMQESTGNVLGIEVNPRFGGGYPLSYSAGANFSRWVIEEYLLDRKIHEYDAWEDNLLMLRYDDEILSHGYKN